MNDIPFWLKLILGFLIFGGISFILYYFWEITPGAPSRWEMYDYQPPCPELDCDKVTGRLQRQKCYEQLERCF